VVCLGGVAGVVPAKADEAPIVGGWGGGGVVVTTS